MKTDLIVKTDRIDMQILREGYDLRAGRTEDPSLIFMHIRMLDINDLSQLMEFQSCVHCGIEDKEQFVFTDQNECSDSLNNDICIGVFSNNSLIAACILVINRDSDRNIGAKMGYDPLQSATLDSVFISPEYRGMGLQNYLISLRLELAAQLGAKYAFATVSPQNVHSLNNLQSSGFCSIYKGTMYGNFERFVMMRQLY